MNNDRQEKDMLSRMIISASEEAAIKQRADRVGKQFGEVVSSFLAEIMISILATKPKVSSPRSQSTLPGSVDILTATEVAEILKVSKAKAYKMMQQGEILAVQFDRTRRVRRQDLDEFIKGHLK
jgi:excisionase family DNA binding protein